MLTKEDEEELKRVEKVTQSWGEDGRPIQQSGVIDVNPAAHIAESDEQMANAVFDRLKGVLEENNAENRNWLEERFG